MSNNIASKLKAWVPIIAACGIITLICGLYLMSSMSGRVEPDFDGIRANMAEVQKKLAALQDLPPLPPMLDTVALVQTTAKACGLRIETRATQLNIDGRPIGYNGPVPAWRLLLASETPAHLFSCASLLTAEADLMLEAFGIQETRSELFITIFGSLGPTEDRAS